MVEQEDQVTEDAKDDKTVEEIEEAAAAILPKHSQRGGIYIVTKEFTQKRKQLVGSIFRPRRYPRLRPRKLRELIANGYLRLASNKEAVAQKQAPKTVSHAGDHSIRHVGGGWYEVTVGKESVRVKGHKESNEALAQGLQAQAEEVKAKVAAAATAKATKAAKSKKAKAED